MTEELVPGRLVAVADGVRRIIAPNPSMMTGPGTNTYLVGVDEVAVIDPGPAIDEHLRLIAGIAGIRWIVVTHTHPDHSPGAAALAALTGGTLVGLPAPAGRHQDRTFRPDWQPAHEDVLRGAGFSLRFLHTPGHASNHVCLLLDGLRWLFTGDHVMGGSTVVIDPPDGNMGAYLRSLAALRRLDLAAIAPGHGEVIDSPHAVIDWLIDHRLGRERKVSDALAHNPGSTAAQLVPQVYADVDERLYRLAERSLLAHLIKLREDGRARENNGDWWAIQA